MCMYAYMCSLLSTLLHYIIYLTGFLLVVDDDVRAAHMIHYCAVHVDSDIGGAQSTHYCTGITEVNYCELIELHWFS